MEAAPELGKSGGPRIGVIIPAYNEARNLPYVLPMIPDWVHEVILVDGHSIDGTIEVARHLLPEIIIIRQRGKGKGDALQCGLAASTSDIIVLMDADGSSDPQEMERFIEVLLAGADFAKGSRFIKNGGSDDITALRTLGNRVLKSIVNYLFRVRFTDLCYGYLAFWKECLVFFDVDCDGFEVETLISLRACKANLKIVEVSSFEHPRIHGASNLRIVRDGWRVLRVILKEWLHGRSMARPIQLNHLSHQENIIEGDLAITSQIETLQ